MIIYDTTEKFVAMVKDLNLQSGGE